jgi:hypothetical protein
LVHKFGFILELKTEFECCRVAAFYQKRAPVQQSRREVEERDIMKLSTTSKLPSDEPKLNKDEQVKSDSLPSKKEKHELSSLVKSIKMKSKQAQLPPDRKMSKKDVKLQSAGKVKMELQHDLSTLVQSVKRKSKNLKK